MRMPQSTRCLRAIVAATATSCLLAATAHADPEPDNVLHGRSLKRDSKTEVHTVVLPQLFGPGEYKGRRYKDSTILQLDAKLGERSDLVIRLQAKQKKFLHVEIRF